MIVKCPNCGFEQPFEGDYCANCGGDLHKLLAAQKKQRKRELIKTRAILVSLSTFLIVGYLFIFYGGSKNQDAESLAQNELQETSESKPVKLTPSKIVSRAAAPPAEPKGEPQVAQIKKRATKKVSLGEITNQQDDVASTQALAAQTLKKETVVEKSIKSIQLLDRFNCDNAEIKVVLNEDETQELQDCSQVVVSDIASKETFILEEGEATVSMSLYLSENTLEVIMTVLIEDEPKSFNYFFNLPQTKTSTASVVFPIQLKSSSPEIEKLMEGSPILPLFFKGENSTEPSNWSPLFFHATF